MAAVRIENDAWISWKFQLLARLCNMPGGHVHAIISCAQIWSWQTDNYSPETPTYCVSRDLVETYLGPGAAEHMIRCELARDTADGLYIRGSKGRIEWLWQSRENGRRGGQASAKNRKPKDKELPPLQPPLDPWVDQGVNQGLNPNANATSNDQSSDPSPHTRGRAIPGAPEHTYVPDLGARARGQLGDRTWARLNEIRRTLAAEFGISDALDLHPHDRGRRDLGDRIRESGDQAEARCAQVLAVLEAEARRDRKLEWLCGKSFTEGGWQRAWSLTLADVHRERAGPRAAGTVEPVNRNNPMNRTL